MTNHTETPPAAEHTISVEHNAEDEHKHHAEDDHKHHHSEGEHKHDHAGEHHHHEHSDALHAYGDILVGDSENAAVPINIRALA